MKENTKDWIKYGSAVIMIASGIILVFICFFLTLTVSNGVLAYTGESFGAALTLFGLTSYFKAETDNFKASAEKFKDEVRRELHRQRKEDDDDTEVQTGAPV